MLIVCGENRYPKTSGLLSLQVSIYSTANAPLWILTLVNPAATLHYAKPALEIAQCPLPPKIVTANDVKMGKPHPEP